MLGANPAIWMYASGAAFAKELYLVRQSEIATGALDAAAGDADTAFYQGKIAAARFFAETVLPRLAAEREIVETTTTDLMDLPEAAFWQWLGSQVVRRVAHDHRCYIDVRLGAAAVTSMWQRCSPANIGATSMFRTEGREGHLCRIDVPVGRPGAQSSYRGGAAPGGYGSYRAVQDVAVGGVAAAS